MSIVYVEQNAGLPKREKTLSPVPHRKQYSRFHVVSPYLAPPRTHGQSLKRTSSTSGNTIKVFIGIDSGDPLLDITVDSCHHTDIIARVFGDKAIQYEKVICDTSVPNDESTLPKRGQVCNVWRKLAKTSFDQGAAYAVLVGDDVRFLSADWTCEIKREFSALHSEAFPSGSSPAASAVPVGFGVLCFTDVNSPGFPGFPVLHRTHYEIFSEIFPAIFVNQDADPWIFQVKCVASGGCGSAVCYAHDSWGVAGVAQKLNISRRLLIG